MAPPPNFFKILNSRYIFKILENKLKKNYICPPRLRILVLSLMIISSDFGNPKVDMTMKVNKCTEKEGEAKM